MHRASYVKTLFDATNTEYVSLHCKMLRHQTLQREPRLSIPKAFMITNDEEIWTTLKNHNGVSICAKR